MMQKSPPVHPVVLVACVALAIFWVWFGTKLYWSVEEIRMKVGILAIPTMVWIMVTFFANDAEEPNFNRTLRPFWVLPRDMRLVFIVTGPAILAGCFLAYAKDVVGGRS